MAELYTYAVEADRFYFVNRLVNREVAALAPRIFIDEVLSRAHPVEIVQP